MTVVWWCRSRLLQENEECPLFRGAAVLAEAGVHQFRGTGGADRGHAPGAGGEAPLDFRGALPARAQLLHVVAGPEAQQLATYIGWLLHRTWGGLAAGVLFILPSFVLLVILA
jgi:hypothetical protein